MDPFTNGKNEFSMHYKSSARNKVISQNCGILFENQEIFSMKINEWKFKSREKIIQFILDRWMSFQKYPITLKIMTFPTMNNFGPL